MSQRVRYHIYSGPREGFGMSTHMYFRDKALAQSFCHELNADPHPGGNILWVSEDTSKAAFRVRPSDEGYKRRKGLS